MATSERGRRTRFDNIAAGSAAARENILTGQAGTSSGAALTERWRTVSGGASSPGANPEHLWRTVTGGVTTDFTTDRGH